jgi:signal transduction histidine kinase/CheY-like chemotaxis protein/HPt (histidine-containing phosphotransfer) domain-containing protein
MLRKFKSSLRYLSQQKLKLSFFSWAGIVAPLMCLALLPLAMFYTQYKNNALKPLHYSVDSIFPLAYLLEREHARFAALAHKELEHTSAQTPASLQNLKKRYEILISRYLILKNAPSLEVLKDLAEYKTVIDGMEAFIKLSDPIMEGMGQTDVKTEDIESIFKEIDKNTLQLLNLSNAAEIVVYRMNDEQATLLENQGKWVFRLIAVQWFLLIGALLALMIYISKQRVQNIELRRLTAEMREASQHADQANKAKSMFLANMSHELRTPFQGLMGMLHLLSETPLTPVQLDYAHTALASSHHLLGILNDILDTSAIESGSMALNIAPLNLQNLISDAEALMQSAAKQKNIDFQVIGVEALPVWIEGDAKRLSQVLFNLLSNAIKFTDSGQVVLELRVLAAPTDDQLPVLSCKVRDTGIGMSEETVKGLFARFHQGDNTIHRRYGGSGLGLEISLNLAKLMGGGICVKSLEGIGTTFTFEFPYKTAIAPAIQKVAAVESVQNLRILIADDHPVNVKYLQILLENMGHTTLSCENGERVLACLKEGPVDVILMDLHMPVLDGISTTTAIRQLEGSLKDIKIIMVSADILPEARRQAFEAGVTEFLSKPVQADSLRQALSRTFEVRLNQLDMFLPQIGIPLKNVKPKDVNFAIFKEFQDLMPVDMVNKQLEIFFGKEAQAIQTMSKVIDAFSREEIAENAHAMKGVCLLFGLTAMAHTLAAIEQGAPKAPKDQLESLLARFQADIDQSRQVLNSELLLH